MAKSSLGKQLAKIAPGHDSGSAKDAVKKALPGDPKKLHGPSPNPATNLLLADVVLRSGTMIARRAVERQLLGSKYSNRKAAAILRGRTLSESVLHSVISRVAVRSVPGAILVGGGLIAKTLYDRAKGHQARGEGEAKLHAMAKDGADEV